VREALVLEVRPEPLPRIEADVAVGGCFSDARPLRGGAGLLDWRLCGALSRLLVSEALRGEPGECVLVPTHGRLRAPRALVVGLGPRAAFGPHAFAFAVRDAVARVVALGAASAALDLPVPEDDWSSARLAAGWVQGFLDAAGEGAEALILRIPAPPEALTPLRVALERAVAGHPRGRLVVRGPASPAPLPVPPGPRRPPAPASPAASARTLR
jgi:hypothetical protein